jgi:hypothetical protein
MSSQDPDPITTEPDAPVPRRPASRASALKVERLIAAAETLQRERTRRIAADRALEEQRSESHHLRVELGRVRAELELARVAQLEAESASSELDAARTQAFAAREALAREQAETERLRAGLARAEATRAQPAAEPEIAQAARVAVPRLVAHAPKLEAARPLNPSLRRRTNWVGRALALLIMLAVIAAIVLVIHTTV